MAFLPNWYKYITKNKPRERLIEKNTFFIENIIEPLPGNQSYDFLNLLSFVLVCLCTSEFIQSLNNCHSHLINVNGKCQQFTKFKTNFKILP